MLKRKSYKWVLAGFVLMYSFTMVLGNSFSWMTSNSNVKNELHSDKFNVILQEVFTPNFKWAAGSTHTKVVTVKNTGDVPAVVRVKLTENFLSFAFDNTQQNGKLVTVDQPSSNPVDSDDVSTWPLKAANGETYTEDGINYKAYQYDDNSTVFNFPSDPDAREVLNSLRYIIVNQPSGVKNAVDPSDNHYWVYENGWFYYSEILKPGQSTTPLTESLKVTDKLPQSHKFALYKMEVSMEALGVASEVLTAWSDDLSDADSGGVYNMLANKLLYS